MTTATLTYPSPAPAAAPVRRGFPGLRCPLCGSNDVQRLDLDDLQTLTCSACEETYTLDDVRELLASWGKLLAWIEEAPAAE